MRALTFLLHVFGQLTYKWQPLPEQAPRFDADPLAMSVDEWRDLALSFYASPAATKRFERYIEQQDPQAQRLAEACSDHLRRLTDAGGHLLLLGDAAYPELLAEIKDPPLAINVLGRLSLLERPSVSIVGSRQASGRAIVTSFKAARALAAEGRLVVSGGAFGCDVAAHQGVLDLEEDPASTAIVFAGGLGDPYPRRLLPVFRQVAERGGLWISERLWQAPSRPADFPVRNRIIAGLSSLTLVMQAHKRSGALITAKRALDEGRDVAVLRTPEWDVRAEGGEALLAEGATGFDADGPYPLGAM